MIERLLHAVDITDVDEYVATGGGKGLAAARSLAPREVISRITDAGLRGRGGAGFPTGTKWDGVRSLAEEVDVPTYLVCNGAEGEPGTYKDRTLLVNNPFAVLEGMLIGMHAAGASEAFLCTKEKFTEPLEAAVRARDQLIDAGWAGAEHIHVVPGPDAYLFGEEKAMLEVIEDKLPMPRILPPYQSGLFATTTQPNPTVVNNVETFAHVPRILTHGADWFREVGTEASPGTMVFTVVGDVACPGVYELPMGVTLRTLVEDIAGADDVLAIFSGTSNTVVTPAQLDTPLCFDAMADAGTGLGSGGFMVYSTDRCIVQVLAALTRFLAIESCGQCNACKLGLADLRARLERIDAGIGDQGDLEAIVRRVPAVTDQSRCYLPTGGQIMVGSTLDAYEQAFHDHVGVACEADPVPVPLIDWIDEDTGEVGYDLRHARKRSDWTYRPAASATS